MNNTQESPLILCVDDDPDIRAMYQVYLTQAGYRILLMENGVDAVSVAEKKKPDLILLDIMMPGMDGYEVCSKLRDNIATAYIPVVFATALGEKQDKAKAFATGAVDYLVKPIVKNILIHKIGQHLETNIKWKDLHDRSAPMDKLVAPSDFILFKEFVCDKLKMSPEQRYRFSKTLPTEIYSTFSKAGIEGKKAAQYMAEFLKCPYLNIINPEAVLLGKFPTPFCKLNHIVPVDPSLLICDQTLLLDGVSDKNSFILSNPFNLDLMEDLKKISGYRSKFQFLISEPESIDRMFRYEEGERKQNDQPLPSKTVSDGSIPEPDLKKNPILHISKSMIYEAISDRASDIHLEPKEDRYVIRFRIDGDMNEYMTLKKATGQKLISRFKVLAGLDISEKRKPQDGAFVITREERTFNLRVATTSTPYGESIVIRLLEPYINPKGLDELGMTDEQAAVITRLINRSTGMILVVGTTGSGKTTTIYSMLYKTDWKARSLMTIEDPIEYRIPSANQQQVNVKAGVTFEALIKSSVRQDPDILFLGEIRDHFSASMAIEFASTGHMTITSMHTTNATSAVFRIERLGIERGDIANAVLAVVAQRLIKKLCPHCKKIRKISPEEIEMLSPFTEDLPDRIADPVGCPKCNRTGYNGREGIYEILEVDTKIAEMIRNDISVAEIRSFVTKRGGFLQSHHAVEKIKRFVFTPKDVHDILIEDAGTQTVSNGGFPASAPNETKRTDKVCILVVEDDPDTQKLIALILENKNYAVSISGDGIDALISLDKQRFDLVLADVNMPNLDGFKLLEMMNQKRLNTPVIFLSSRDRPEDEEKGLKLGAADYISKPFQKQILLMRIEAALNRKKGE